MREHCFNGQDRGETNANITLGRKRSCQQTDNLGRNRNSLCVARKQPNHSSQKNGQFGTLQRMSGSGRIKLAAPYTHRDLI